MIVILTSGLDASGVNAFLYSFGSILKHSQQDLVFVQYGFEGLLKSNFIRLHLSDLEKSVYLGSSQIGLTPSIDLKNLPHEQTVLAIDNLAKIGASCLVVLGDRTAHKSAEVISEHNIPVITIPCSAFNEVPSSWYSIGYHTCLNATFNAIKHHRVLADASNQIVLLEVKNDNAGSVTINAGIAAMVDYVVNNSEPKTCQDLMTIIRDIKAHNPAKKSILIVFSQNLYGESGGHNLPSLPEVAAQLTIQLAQDCKVAVIDEVSLGVDPLPSDIVTAIGFAKFAHEQIENKNFNVALGYDGWNYYYTVLSEANSIDQVSQSNLVEDYNKLYKIIRQ